MPKGDKDKLKADPLDGTTPVANLLLEALAIADLSGKEKGAVLHLWRETYGWTDTKTGHRLKTREITLAEWATVLHTARSHASSILGALAEKHVFNREFKGAGRGYIYSMNTDVSAWNSGCIDHGLLLKLVTVTQNGNSYTKVEQFSEPSGKSTSEPKLEDGGVTQNGNSYQKVEQGGYQKVEHPTLLKKDIKESIKEKEGVVLPDWLDKETWNDFLEMRKKLKAPMTDKAKTIMFNKLADFKQQGMDPVKVVEQSIMNSWKGVFPLKDNNGGTHGQYQKGVGGAGAHSLKESITKPFN